LSQDRHVVSDTGPLISLEKLGDGLHISGIAGQIFKAFRTGTLPSGEAQDKLRELLDAGRINKKIYDSPSGALRSS
jgi:hypothetical protein